jgi:FkbM family methyltransferase
MNRILLLKHYLSGHRNNVRVHEIARRLFRSSAKKRAMKMIADCKLDSDYWKVSFHNITSPLYWPKHLDLRELYQVTAEIFYPDDWHFYEWKHTRVAIDDVVVDCGAAEGLFGLTVVHRCKKVYAVEPLPGFCSSMQATFAEKKNVQIIPAALSNKIGTAVIAEQGIYSPVDDENCLSNGGVPVQVTTIDELFWTKQIPVTYIKADLEGYELKMLEGARKTITAYRPKIAITTYHRKDHADQIIDFLRSLNLGYKIKLKGIDYIWGVPVMLHAWIE